MCASDTGKMSGRGSARYSRRNLWRSVGSGHRNGYEAAAGLDGSRHHLCNENDGIELNEIRCGGDQQVNRSCGRMRVWPLHVDDGVIFRNLQLRKMSVQKRGLTSIGVHMKERSINTRKKQRECRAAGYQSSHRRNSVQVNL